MGVLLTIVPILVIGWILRRSLGAIRAPHRRAAMLASGAAVVAALLAADRAFGHVALVGVPGFLVGCTILLPLGSVVDHVPSWGPVEVACALVYWIVDTALLGTVVAALWARRPGRRAAVASLVCALALGAAGCITDTPPPTPNQRAVERNAPAAVVPPPPDAGRTPRPASP